MTHADDLAAEIRTAIDAGTVEKVLADHLADPVSVHHDPAQPTDGPMDRDVFAALLTGNPMAAMVPDGVRTYGELAVDGDTVSFASTLVGTTTAGQALRIANTTVMTLEDGRIVKLVQRYDPDTMAALSKLAPAPE